MKLPLLVATAASDEYRSLALITEKTKRQYALLHNYDFHPFKHHNPSRIAWERVEIWKQALALCGDWLFWTGCDVMITNPGIALETLIDPWSDFIFAVDGNGLQSDSWLMRNCDATRNFLDKVYKWEGKTQNEQDAMSMELSGEPILSNFMSNFPPRGGTTAPESVVERYKVDLNRSAVRCKIVPQRLINAYPTELYGGTSDDSWGWHKGDFCLHLPGKSLEERIHFFSSFQ